ncbi:MAG TPA: hypothetical protein VEQ59_04380, partial [Polyangiaceae bacterium]|nr:hypothetical protein [Polyangiaceae bacterium]
PASRCIEAPTTSCDALVEARRKRAKTQKVVAFALAGGALLSGGSAVALALVNDARYRAWIAKEQAFTSGVRRDPTSFDSATLESQLADANSIRNCDAVVVGLGVAAGSLALASLGLYLTAGSGAPTLSASTHGDFSAGYRASF